MLYRISVTERGLTGIANIFRSRLSRLDDLLGAGTVPLMASRQGAVKHGFCVATCQHVFSLSAKKPQGGCTPRPGCVFCFPTTSY